MIVIRDDGEGIEPDDVPHVFERFYRGNASRSPNRGSAGLGLAITRVIVVAHGGTIDVSSPPGGGTAFRIALPLLSVPAMSSAVSSLRG